MKNSFEPLHWYLLEKGFVHPIFRFWFLVTFGEEVTKIWKYYIIFVYILQGNHASKVTQIPETKRQKYVMNEPIDFVVGLSEHWI